MPGEKLTASYCEQTLIPAWEREHGPIAGIYRDPRGELHEPHGLRTIRLGTREVAAYVPPSWTFDKILVVEKAGLWPVLEAARIADRYDMAMVTSEGFATEAARDLLADLHGRDMTVFVLHDADHPGYNIARTLGEETARMPGHHIDVIDLGLTVEDAIARGMDPEPYDRESALPARLVPTLTDAAREWFTGTVAGRNFYGEPNKWRCKRVDLNAFSSPGLIAYIEEGLNRHGADTKVIPPDDVMGIEAAAAHRGQIRARVEEIIAQLVRTDQIVDTLIGETAEAMDLAITGEQVGDRLDGERDQPWRAAVASEIAERISGTGISLRDRVAKILASRAEDEDEA